MQTYGTDIDGRFVSARACAGGRDLGTVSVQISEGKISRIERGKKRGAVALDDSLWLAPGLLDLQVNGGFGIDLLRTPERLVDLATYLPHTGALGFLAALPSPPASVAKALARATLACRRQNRGALHSRSGPRSEVLGIHLEGPLLNPARRGAHPRRRLLSGREAARHFEETISVVDSRGRHLVRMVTMAPEVDGAEELAAAARRHRVITAAGHTDASYAAGVSAIERGIGIFTHVFNACRPLHHREPGILAAFLLRPSTFLTLICDGVHVSEPMVRLLVEIVGPSRIALVTDAVAGLSWPQARGESKASIGAATDSDGRLVGGTTPLSVCAANFARFSGIDFPAALHSASGVPAKILGIKGWGTLRVGSPARLVAVSEEGKVAALVQGSYLFELESMKTPEVHHNSP